MKPADSGATLDASSGATLDAPSGATRPRRFPLRLRGPATRAVLMVYGVRPGRAYVQLEGRRIMARFGWLRATTDLGNIESFEITGPYRWLRAIGYRISLHDRDATFGSSAHGGLCLRFRTPVHIVFDHPTLTLTVDDIDALATALRERGVPGVDRRGGTS